MMLHLPSVIPTLCTGFFSLAIIIRSPMNYYIIEDLNNLYLQQTLLFTREFDS